MKALSIRQRTLRVGRKDEIDLRELNRMLRGERKPQRCTCAEDHGWH